MSALAGRVVGDDRADVAVEQDLAQGVAVAGVVALSGDGTISGDFVVRDNDIGKAFIDRTG